MRNIENNSKDKYSDWEAPEEKSSIPETQDPISERVNQSYSSRLCEYVTGMKPENPELLNKLEEDQKIIRSKYNLPNPNLPPAEFERALNQLAKEMDIEIRPKHEYSRLFDEAPDAGAMSLDGGKIIVGIDRNNERGYKKSLKQMEHELVHGIQEKIAKSMPIELMEYEAYISNGNIELLKSDPEMVNDILFKTLIGGSVEIYYDLESQKRGEKLSPVWDNPEYFIQKDEQAKVVANQSRSEQDQKQIQELRSQLGIPNPE